jgi:hypothetical protein
MAKAELKSFEKAEEVRQFPKGRWNWFKLAAQPSAGPFSSRDGDGRLLSSPW